MKEKLEFKIASEDWEFEQIARLNYRTFVEEIPQHEKNQSGSLPDKFHSENTYIICTRKRKLLGMMAVRDIRPFSLDQKLPDLDSYLPEFRCPCEFRLLSIEQEHRNLRILQGLMVVLARFADEKGYDIALISANVKRLRFYEQFGFKAFGSVVGTEDAPYQPMYLTLQSSLEFRKKSKIMKRLPDNFSMKNKRVVNLLPGPVSISAEVKQAMADPPVSHRSDEFKGDLNFVKKQLSDLVHSKNVEIFMGSGSLANDAVAGQLSRLSSKGLILSNGEFGERLVDHAKRAGLLFDVIKLPWGEGFDYRKIERTLADDAQIGWIWAVHSETSTGVLNDLDALKEITNSAGIKLCLDCVSSVGIVPVDLDGVYLASSVSGKGLASYAGLSFVFYNHEILPSNSIPRYLDIGFYAESGGIPFTISSNLLYALREALSVLDIKARHRDLLEISNWAMAKIKEAGFNIIGSEDTAMPGVITIALPQWLGSEQVGKRLQDSGFLVHWRSLYLIKKNWIQIAFMGRHDKGETAPLFKLLSSLKPPLSKAL